MSDVTITGQFLEYYPSLPAPEDLMLKVGAQVMMCNNEFDDQQEIMWRNGSIGRIVAIDAEQGVITVMINDKQLSVYRHKWTSYRYTWNRASRSIEQLEMGSFIQYPIKLAWAVTIHKSQGLSFDKVNINLGRGAFAAGQTYVALSRCRTLAGMTLTSPIKANDIFTDKLVDAYMASVEQREVNNLKELPLI